MENNNVIGFQTVDAEGNVIGFVSKEELINDAKQALYADLAYMEANRPATLEIEPLASTSTMAATDEYEDQLPIVTDAPYVRVLDAAGNPARMTMQNNASVVGGLLKPLIPIPAYSNNTTKKITLPTQRCAIGILNHAEESRTPSVAVLRRSNTGVYSVQPIINGNLGGFAVSEDGSGIITTSSTSWKEVIVIPCGENNGDYTLTTV